MRSVDAGIHSKEDRLEGFQCHRLGAQHVHKIRSVSRTYRGTFRRRQVQLGNLNAYCIKSKLSATSAVNELKDLLTFPERQPTWQASSSVFHPFRVSN